MGNDMICGEKNLPTQTNSSIPLSSFNNPSISYTKSKTEKNPQPQPTPKATTINSKQIIRKIPYQTIEDFCKNPLVLAVVSERDRIFQNLRKDPVRKALKQPSVSFASSRHIQEGWGSQHLLNNFETKASNVQTSLLKIGDSRRDSRQFFSHREVALKPSEVIVNRSREKDKYVYSTETMDKSPSKRPADGVDKHFSKSSKHKSILKKRLCRKVDMKKLREFEAAFKKEFLEKKKAIHKEKGIPSVVQTDCFTYLLHSGGTLTRNILRPVWAQWAEAGLGSAAGAVSGLHVQGLFQG